MAVPSRFSSNALLALTLLLSFGAQVYSATTENPLITIYEKWISDFGRVYKSNVEKQQRFEVFQKNYQFIQSMKNQPDLTYTVDLNEFADLTNEEFLAKYVGFKAKKSIHSKYENFTAAPTCIDWRSLGAVTPVQDQGSYGGSWAISATGSIESICKIKTGTLINLSEVDLIHCCNSSCGYNGASVDCAFKCVIQNLNGCITPNCENTFDCICRICSYQDVTPHCESCLKNVVANQPVSAVIDASGSAIQFYSSGIFTGPCGTNLNHAILIVGYGPCSTGTSYWIVKNSWGTSWGESGYIRMQRNVASTAGLCGIAIEPSYPNMC